MPNAPMLGSFSTANAVIPGNGPKCIPVKMDFTNTPEFSLDGEQIVSSGQIEYLQGVFIDNADNSTTFSLVCEGTNQRIVCPPNSQGYFSIMAQTPPKMTAKTTQVNGRVITCHFYNVPIQGAVWKTV